VFELTQISLTLSKKGTPGASDSQFWEHLSRLWNNFKNHSMGYGYMGFYPLSVTGLGIAIATASTLCNPIAVLAKPTVVKIAEVEQIRVTPSKRIAVLDLDFANVSKTGTYLGLYGQNGPSKGISNLLTNELVKNGTYVLIERSKVEAILAEQNLGQSDRLEPSTAAQIGRLLGVDAVLMGSITQFNMEDQDNDISVGQIFGLGGKQKRQIANVQISTRLVGTATGEILSAAEGSGQADKSGGGGSIFGISASTGGDSSDRLLGEAAKQAVDQVVSQLVTVAPKLAALPDVLPTIEPVIADITGQQVTLNKGGQDGFRPGMVLSVERVIKEIKDPETGKLLRRQTQPIGRLQLTEVDVQSSVATILNGQGFKVGDRAKAVE
jgi:curli biogenesis system outer membrane secretion channel CsgG